MDHAEQTHTVVELSPIRRVIAARMTEAKRAIPHFRLAADFEIDRLVALRAELNRAEPARKLSLNDFIIKAAALALTEVPAVNAQWQDGRILRFRQADISVVTALPDGLSTPIVRNCQAKSVHDIAAEVKRLAGRAARNQLRMDEIAGGTFSISNLGMFEVESFDAIINAPQCAILAVGAAKLRPVVSDDGTLRVATVLKATLSADHRALDGSTCGAFMTAMRYALGRPERLLE
jgi:pyruvate dehydrogenase E2 component (dihydrolipoamide acetyltransferase)